MCERICRGKAPSSSHCKINRDGVWASSEAAAATPSLNHPNCLENRAECEWSRGRDWVFTGQKLKVYPICYLLNYWYYLATVVSRGLNQDYTNKDDERNGFKPIQLKEKGTFLQARGTPSSFRLIHAKCGSRGGKEIKAAAAEGTWMEVLVSLSITED